MKAHFHKVPISLQNSFSVRQDIQSFFSTIWHYHPEIELHYTLKGEGVRFIGDNISNFSKGDMVLLGQNLPHTWRCREEYFMENSNLEVEAIVLHFLPECLGRDFLNLPEAYLIPKLFDKAKRGLIVEGEAKERIATLMHSAVEANNLDSLIVLLSILKILAENEDMKTIASPQAQHKTNDSELERLNTIYSYTFSHYKREIKLEEIAAIANLSVTSFCRYFKQTTKKSYNDFLIEIRISHVCRALIEDKLATEVISFECGFNNVSNFYRHFKKVTKMTPFEYKRKFLNV
jgi:AraC-like DNA-binding protein